MGTNQEKRAHPPTQFFGPRLLWAIGWMDEDATWYGSRPRPRPHCIRRGPSSSRKGHSSPFLFGPCLLWPRSPISATAEHLFYVLWRFKIFCPIDRNGIEKLKRPRKILGYISIICPFKSCALLTFTDMPNFVTIGERPWGFGRFWKTALPRRYPY